VRGGVWLRLGLRAPQTLACQPRRGCLPPVAGLLRPGEGERPPVPRNASRRLLARPSMQGGGHAIVASYTHPPRRNRRRRATRSRRPDCHCPRRVCAAKAGRTQGQCGDGTRLEGRLPRRHGWQPWRGARLRQVGYGSARNSLADTRARRPYHGCAAVAAPTHVNATACDLESAHAPLLAYHSYNELTSPMSAR